MARSTTLPVVHLPDPTNENEFVGVIKGVSIRCYGKEKKYLSGGPGSPMSAGPTWVPYDQTFKIGDYVEYDSYNLSYTGRIISITDKTIVVRKGDHPDAKTARMSLRDFNFRNKDFNLAATQKRNSEWMD